MNATELIQLLEQLRGHYQMLVKYSALQHQFVVQDEAEGLVKLLDRRNAVVETVGALESQLRPIKLDWQAYAMSLDEPSRSHAEQLLGECRDMLERITKSDHDDALILQQRKLQVGRQLVAAQSGRKVQRSYAGSAYGQSKVEVQG